MLFHFKKRLRVAIFGGSFDPPHRGHVEICRWLLDRQAMDEVWVIPCFIHPFGKGLSLFEDRIVMARLAFSPLGKRVTVLDVEKQLGGISYTVRTIQHLQKEYPQHRFHLVSGDDSESRADEWHDSETLKRLVPLITVPRGASSPIPDVASTTVRERLQQGVPSFDLVPTEIAVYIITHHLYR